MGNTSIGSSQSVESQARYIVGLMAQDGHITAPQATDQTPPMQGDRTAASIGNRGNASPTVAIGVDPQTQAAANGVSGQTAVGYAQQAIEPPALFTTDQGQVVTQDGQPYLGMTIFQDAQTGAYHDGQGNPINLEAEEAKRGIGVPVQTDGAAATGQGQPAEDPNAPMVDYNRVDGAGRPQIVYPNGEPFLGRALFVDEASGAIFDKEGKSVDPATLGVPQGPTPEEQKLAKKIQVGTAVASGGFNLYMNKVWYNSTLPGMTSKLQSLQRSSKSFKAGTSLQGKMKDVPVLNRYANWRQSSRTNKIDKLQRNIKLTSMTPKQEALFNAKTQLKNLQAESKAFTQGKSMLGRMKDAPVVGSIAKGVETRRTTQIRTLKTQIKTGHMEANWKTKIGNATRGRVLPGLMALGSGWGTYTEIRESVRRKDDPTNVRKWDDYTRIAGGALQTGGALAALKRGNVKGAIITATAGTLISTVGEIFKD
jgi:hypothetical protein